MSRETYYQKVQVSRKEPRNTDEPFPIDELPEVSADENNVCKCPYCANIFRIRPAERKSPTITDGNSQHCLKCGHVWKKRGTEPKKCPKCGSYRWNIADTEFECQRCHHIWTSSAPDGPQRCPACRTYDWRIPPSVMESSLPHEPHENTLKRWVCERYESGMGVIDIAKELKLPVLKVANLVKRYLDVPSPRY